MTVCGAANFYPGLRRAASFLRPSAYPWVSLGDLGWNWVYIGGGVGDREIGTIWSSGHLKGKDLGGCAS
jgi:hypothetical protein